MVSEREEIAERIYTVIAAIPVGKVATYGNIAKMAGIPRGARQVGRLLKQLPAESQLPWYRVVNHQGRISLTGERSVMQKRYLIAEGIFFSSSEKIDLKRDGWLGEELID